jgi:hypothetical protein
MGGISIHSSPRKPSPAPIRAASDEAAGSPPVLALGDRHVAG